MEKRGLFGGAIEVDLPLGCLDLSDFRQVPDNQEVFTAPDSDITFVVELLEMKSDVANSEAGRFFWQDLVNDNEALNPTIRREEERNVLQGEGGFASVVMGEQTVCKGKEGEGGWSRIMVSDSFSRGGDPRKVHLGVVRLSRVQTDLLMSLSTPVDLLRDGRESALEGSKLSLEDVDQLFDSFFSSLDILDWGLVLKERKRGSSQSLRQRGGRQIKQFPEDVQKMSLFKYVYQLAEFSMQMGYKLGQANPSFTATKAAILEQFNSGKLPRSLTEVIHFTGISMLPTLNPRADRDSSAVDRLLLRLLPIPSTRNCHVGDVVAFQNPFRPNDPLSILVRRIAAMPGDEMIPDTSSLESFLIPYDHCWVLADNAQCPYQEVMDSRFFGPVPFENIRGRVIYNGYDKQDHGPVQNSPQAASMDEAVLKVELDLDRFFD